MELNKQSLTDLLVPSKVDSRHFLKFCMPNNFDESEVRAWMERMTFIYTDLKWLLSLSVDAFWCQVIFDQSWISCLDTFLQHAPRHYDLRSLPEQCKSALNKVGRLFLIVLKRMSVYDENPNLCFSPAILGQVLYDNFLFDMAKMFDMCSVFYRPTGENNMLIKEILHSVFLCQDNYYHDLAAALRTVSDTLDTLEKRVLLSQAADARTLPTVEDARHELKPISEREAREFIYYLYDVANTMSAFAELFPNGGEPIFASNLLSKFGFVCEQTLPVLVQRAASPFKRHRFLMHETLQSFAKMAVNVLQHGCIDLLSSDARSSEAKLHLSVEFLHTLDVLSHYPKFLASLNDIFALEHWFVKVGQLSLPDETNFAYVRNIVQDVLTVRTGQETVKQLRELLPNSSSDFISKCVSEYGPHTDVIMNNIMEGVALHDLGPAEGASSVSAKSPLVVPDKDVLEDKAHVARLKERLFDATAGDAFADYDDEYDDTYDSQNVAAGDADSADELTELTARRKFTVPLVLQQAMRKAQVAQDDEEEEDEDTQDGGEEDAESPEGPQHENPDGEEVNEGADTPQHVRGRGGASPGNLRNHRSGPHRGRRGRGRGGKSESNSGSSDRQDAAAGRGQGRGNAGHRSRGRGRGNDHNRRRLADKKRQLGMYS